MKRSKKKPKIFASEWLTVGCTKEMTSKGRRLIISAEIAEGILFEEDYHDSDSMDGESYKCYFEKSICQNIPKHSVIVIDNAPYHPKNTENYPTSKWQKQQFVDWLTEKNITFPDKV